MAYREIDINLTDEQKAMRDTVRRFGTEIMRPAGIELDKLHISRHGLQAYREVIRVMLILEAFPNTRVAAVDDHLVAWDVRWSEERETHDVIPVSMANQQVNNALAFATGTLHQFNTELSDT